MRVTMEDRRGELLLREVGRRIIQEALAEADAEYPVETDTEVVPSNIMFHYNNLQPLFLHNKNEDFLVINYYIF